MDDNATTIVYSVGASLYLYDAAAGTSRAFASGSAPSISQDGTRVAYLSPVNGIQQAWTGNTAGTQIEQLTNEPAGIASVTLSGNGNFAIVVTGTNSILKYSLSAAGWLVPRKPRFRRVQILPPTPAPSFTAFSDARGSISTVLAPGLARETLTGETPLPLSLAGYRVLLNGNPAPILGISPTGLVFQLPWELPFGNTRFQLKTPDPNPVFEASPFVEFVGGFDPVFITQPCLNFDGERAWCIVATHADSIPVTAGNPAKPGETINLSAVGLGAVSPAVATGMPAPANPPAVVQHSFVCQLVAPFGSQQAGVQLGNLQMVGAKLTPGAVGTYTVTVRLPNTTGGLSTAIVECEDSPLGPTYYAAGMLPVKPSQVPAK
jgi:uncharacterized protein (TIGR03437 family)